MKKLIPDLNNFKNKVCVIDDESEALDLGNISYSNGTKCIIKDISPSLEGWHIELDITTFIKENYELNKEWGLEEKDFERPLLIIWNVNKYPDILPIKLI